MKWHDFKELMVALAIAAGVILLVQSAIEIAPVEGSSMEPLLHNDEQLLINKAAYLQISAHDLGYSAADSLAVFAGPQRGDLVVFRPPANPDELYIKRVIALPGESIRITGGKVYINGTLLYEPYLKETPKYETGMQRIGQDSYYVLGDNRNNSNDSYKFGPIPRSSIAGRAELRVLPFDLSTVLIDMQRPVLEQK